MPTSGGDEEQYLYVVLSPTDIEKFLKEAPDSQYVAIKAFKLFKTSKSRKSARNRISPELIRSPTYSGTVDARSEIDLQRFCSCRTSLPPQHFTAEPYDNSYYSSYNSYNSSRDHSVDGCNETNSVARSDSAYNSARSSPAHSRVCYRCATGCARSSPAHSRVCYATETYFNVNDSEDSSSIRTEFTILEGDAEDEDERAQNLINESLELVSSL